MQRRKLLQSLVGAGAGIAVAGHAFAAERQPLAFAHSQVQCAACGWVMPQMEKSDDGFRSAISACPNSECENFEVKIRVVGRPMYAA